MMKRWIELLFIVLLMSIAVDVSGCAQEELHWLSPTIGGNEAVMIVDNGEDWSVKLNLRAEAAKGSEIRGRIYTGTRVEIYEDMGEWCTVGLNFSGGAVMTGCVMKQYLSPLEDEFLALCPLATAKTDTMVEGYVDLELAQLQPGSTAYVMAVCGERYFLMLPDGTQGFADADAFEPLHETEERKRIVYGQRFVPSGGLTFEDKQTGEQVWLAGGVQLDDCWQIEGEYDWMVTFGAGIQRSPRVRGRILAEKLSDRAGIPFEGNVYAYENSFICCMGTINEQAILRKTDLKGNCFWALGSVPTGAEKLDREICMMKCEPDALLSEAEMNGIIDHVAKRGALDERTSGENVTTELISRCKFCTSVMLDPITGEIVLIRAWLEDVDGTYVTGGDLDPKTKQITRWGCNG